MGWSVALPRLVGGGGVGDRERGKESMSGCYNCDQHSELCTRYNFDANEKECSTKPRRGNVVMLISFSLTHLEESCGSV